MTNVFVLAADAYRMVDALRDYADIIKVEGSSLHVALERAAERIESGKRTPGGLIEVERFDLDAAHSAVIGVMVDRREAADALEAKANALHDEASRLEALLESF